MRYFLRALKYYLYLALFLTAILWILTALGLAEANLDQLFREGIRSVGKIALMLAALAAIYPAVGFQKRLVAIPSDPGSRCRLISLMDTLGYSLEEESPETLCFRRKKFLQRLTRMGEDRLRFTVHAGGYEVEGLRKDLVRAALRLEYQFRETL